MSIPHSRFGSVAVLVVAAINIMSPAPCVRAADGPSVSIEAAISKSLPLLAKSAATYIEKRDCFTCHHQALPAMTWKLARERGFKVDADRACDQSEFTHEYFTGRAKQLRMGKGVPGGAFSAGYALVSLSADRWQPDQTTADLVQYLFKKQMPDGRWRIQTHRPPLEDSDFTATALSIRGLQLYANDKQQADATKRIERATVWLEKSVPKSNEDHTLRLFGLHWGGAKHQVIQEVAKSLIGEQHDDGGWAQLPQMASDAYSTGQALVALHQAAELPVDNPVYQKGVAYLRKQQLADGSWLVKTRSKPIQKYFESGFPHEKSQFISISGTSWATMALLLTQPVVADKSVASNKSNPTSQKKPSAPIPHWIWHSKKTIANQLVYFRKVFSVDRAIKSAMLVASCDNHVSLFVNGQHLLQHDHWEFPVREDIVAKLTPGKNVIAARCRNDADAAGFLLRLVIEYKDGSKHEIVTDQSWLTQIEPKGNWRPVAYDTSRWKKPHSFGLLGVEPWKNISVDTTIKPSATAADQITVPAGFKVERLYSVPKSVHGSWVSLTSVDKGRLIVSDQYGSLYRVSPGRDSATTRIEKLPLAIGHAHGLLFAFDSLYVVVNGESADDSGLYRLRDTNGDDQFDDVTLLKKLHGYGEHGPHGIGLGSDGSIYVIAGNHTELPEGSAANSPHRNWGEDLLLPRNPDGRGHGTGRMAPGGWIARTDKDGKRWELFCAGFRNPYDLAFNQDGELFTFDADMEWDTGTPWYRPTRINHAVSAAEFGWRYGTGKWPDYFPDSVGSVVDVGLGSPTGIVFGTGARFPAKYQRALFVNDWTYGRIHAVHMKPHGASYTATFETFAQGRPLPVTDIVVHTDGAIYFTTGGRRTQSGLYRITYTGNEPTERVGPLPDPIARRARSTRHRLESFHVPLKENALEYAWPNLNSSDRSLRYAARIAVERQPLSAWQSRAFDETRTNATIQTMLALTRVGQPDVQAALINKLNGLPFAQLTEQQLLDVLRTYALAFIRLGGKTPVLVKSVIAHVDPLFPAGSDLVNRELCRLLVYLESPRVIDRSLGLLKSAQTQQDQMFYVFTLRNLRDGWTSGQRRAYFSWLNLAEANYAGGASFRRFVDQIRQDAVMKLTDAERAQFKDVIAGRGNVEVVKLETTRQFVHNWQLSELRPLLNQVERNRSFKKGKSAYQAAQCNKCHRFAGQGGDTGPDITGVGNRFKPDYLLEALIEPSKVVSDQYRNSIIVTLAGKVITGRIIKEDTDRLHVRTDPFARQLTVIAKPDIEERHFSTVSEMPKGLINVLTKEEILDLIAYMRSAGKSDDPAFVGKPKTP